MSKVIALPGVKPRKFINEDAANQLQHIVDKMRSGQIVGMAWVSMTPNGDVSCGWDFPTNMGEKLYYGVQALSYKMMKEANG